MKNLFFLFLIIGQLTLSVQSNPTKKGTTKTNKGGGCLLDYHNDTLYTQLISSSNLGVQLNWDNSRTQTVTNCFSYVVHCILERQINQNTYDTLLDTWYSNLTSYFDSSLTSNLNYNYRISRHDHQKWLRSYSDTISFQTVGFEEKVDKIIKLYPNPTNYFIFFKIENGLIGEHYTIYNSSGSISRQGELNSNNMKVNILGLSKGVYFLRVNEFSKKFLIID